MLNKLALPLVFAFALFTFSGTASATVLPLNVCSGPVCDWSGFPIEQDPTTGDIWIKFESAPGAGDMGHLFAQPGDVWGVVIGDASVADIPLLFQFPPFLTDMDQPVPETAVNVIYPLIDSSLSFQVEFFEPIFVHDIHWTCNEGQAAQCIQAFGQTGGGMFIAAGKGMVLVPGIWEVPGPGVLILFGFGLAGLAVARRKHLF